FPPIFSVPKQMRKRSGGPVLEHAIGSEVFSKPTNSRQCQECLHPVFVGHVFDTFNKGFYVRAMRQTGQGTYQSRTRPESKAMTNGNNQGSICLRMGT